MRFGRRSVGHTVSSRLTTVSYHRPPALSAMYSRPPMQVTGVEPLIHRRTADWTITVKESRIDIYNGRLSIWHLHYMKFQSSWTLQEGRRDMGKCCTWESSHAPGGSQTNVPFTVGHHTRSLPDYAWMNCKTSTVQPVPEIPRWVGISLPLVHGSAYGLRSHQHHRLHYCA